MSVRTRFEVKPSKVTTYHCDGPTHFGDDLISCSPIVVTIVNKSEDIEVRNDFCSMSCLNDWVCRKTASVA